MDTMLKRVLSFAVALVMALGLMIWNAASVYATEEVSEATEAAETVSFTCTNPDHDHEGETVTWTAWDGTGNLTTTGHYYLNIDGDSVDRSGGLTVKNDIVIDLNGKTINVTGASFRIYYGADSTVLTVQNGTFTYKAGVAYKNAGAFASMTKADCKLYVNGMTVDGNDNTSAASVSGGLIHSTKAGNVIVIKNSTIKNFTTTGYGGAINLYSGTATLENVVFEECYAQSGGNAVAVRNGAVMTMSGDCQITSCGEKAVHVDEESSLTISGGTYDVDVTAYLAEGLSQSEDGKIVEQHTCDENVIVEAVAATCTAPGTTAGTKCSVCGAWVTEPTEVAQLDHSYTVQQEVVAPGCTEDGYTVYKCATCDATEHRDPVIAIGEHSWNDGEVTADPSCTEDGVMTYTCSVCSDTSYTEAIDALGHSFGEDLKCSVCEAAAVASIGEELYTSLEAAVAVANETSGAQIKLLQDLEITEVLTVSSTMTITADKAITITANYSEGQRMINVSGGALTLVGASADSKITLAAATVTTNIINLQNGKTNSLVLTNVHLAGNVDSTTTYSSQHGLNSDGDNDEITATNVTITNVKGSAIRISKASTVAKLDNVIISGAGIQGIHTVGTVEIYNTQDPSNALSISDISMTKDGEGNGIDVKTNGKVVSKLTDVPEGVYPIKIENTAGSGITVRSGVLNITDVSIDSASCGLNLFVAGADATVQNVNITNAQTAVETIADTTLTMENVSVDTCDRAKVSIAGTVSGEITYLDHTEVTDEAVAATCTATGLTEGKHCSVCNEVTVAQEETPMAEHSFADGACSVCGAEDPDFCDHSYAEEITSAATCTEKGLKTFSCSECGDTYTEEIDALGHTEVIDEAVAPTCTETGLTEGKHCSVCSEVTVAQTVVDALGHSFGEDLKCSDCEAVAVASIGEELYTSLKDAVAAANETEEADIITVLCDVQIDSRLDITTAITITADSAVTISASEDLDAHMIHVDGGALTLGSEAAQITLAASVATRNIINIKNTTSTTVTNVHLAGNENSKYVDTNTANGLNIDAGEVAVTDVTITNVPSRGIRVAANCTANLYNVSLSGIGGYGILANGTVKIYDALSITNTGSNSINVANGGKLQSYFENVSADTYAVQIDTSAASGIMVRAGGELVISNVSVKNTTGYGIEVLGTAEVTNAIVSDTDKAIKTADGSTLTAANVSVDTCDRTTVSVADDTLAEGSEISYSEHSYDETGACAGCGVVVVDSWNIVLSDDIGLNFVLKLADSDEVQVKVDGEEVPAQLTQNGDGTYQVMIKVAAAQMTSAIQIVVNGQPVEKTYSVRAYADVILAGEYTDQEKALVNNMLSYGGAAQNYFGVNTENLADLNITVDDVTVPSDNLSVEISDQLDGINFYGASLVMRSKTAVRFYFTAESVDSVTFTVNDTAYTPSSGANGMYYVEAADIDPQALADVLNMVVSDGTNSLTVSYSPMSYISRMYHADGSSDQLKAMVKAMYGYHLAAKAYIASLVQE